MFHIKIVRFHQMHQMAISFYLSADMKKFSKPTLKF